MDAWSLYRNSGSDALWARCLGFMDMGLDEAMALQHTLLGEQLETLQRGMLGRSLVGSSPFHDYAEFCQRVPLTTYEDYALTLGERLEAVLPEAPKFWIRTSGRSGGAQKWVPVSDQWYAANRWHWLGVVLAAMAEERGDVRLKGGERVLNMTAPPPYGSGAMFKGTEELWPMRMFPPTTAEYLGMPFEQRMAAAMSGAVSEGLDLVASQASVLASVGESLAERRPPGSIRSSLKAPRRFARMGRAALRAKVAGRPVYPRDVWEMRGVIAGGMDCTLFRERIREYWGRYPLELLASTEGTLVAFQAWDRTSMTLVPSLNLLEFLAEDQLEDGVDEAELRQHAVLMDGVEAGRNYELILTNFHGGAMVRYRTGDILRVVALEGPSAGIQLPQVVHYARRSELLSVGGFVNLTEQTVWRAIDQAEVPYVDWTIRKEVEDSTPVLRLRIEPRPESPVSAEDAESRIHRSLRALEPDWADMEEIAGLRPLRVTYLHPGTFDRFRTQKVAAGADLGQLKPQHVNTTDAAIEELLAVARAVETQAQHAP